MHDWIKVAHDENLAVASEWTKGRRPWVCSICGGRIYVLHGGGPPANDAKVNSNPWRVGYVVVNVLDPRSN